MKQNLPCRSSGSSNTLNAVNFLGSTPCIPKICMLARENPHCGVSGVPFINKTTGADEMALSIADLVSKERSRSWRGVTLLGMVGRIILGDNTRAPWCL